jgi:hypothetical protein
MANREHLWKKGQPSPNPKGRPKGFSIVAHLKEKLQEVPAGKKETYAELIVKKYFQKALIEGDTKMLRDIVDRVDGKAIQKMDIEGGLSFVVNYDK